MRTGLSLLLLVLHVAAFPQKSVSVFSPDKKITCSVQGKNGGLSYRVKFDGKTVMNESRLGLVFANTEFANNVKIIGTARRTAVENYGLIVGKTAQVSDKYNELTIDLQQQSAPYYRMAICFRAFDHALAFRYIIPAWNGVDSFRLVRENSVFNLPGEDYVRALFFPNFLSSHEGVYNHVPVAQIPNDTLIDLPALFESPSKTFVAVTEAGLFDYAGMYLSNRSGTLLSAFAPLPKDTAVIVKSALPHSSPWRVLLISDRIGDLIESNAITSLSEPCKIGNTGWLRPGKTTFPWWNGNVVPDTINAPGNNFVTAKYYIDFCAHNHIQYHSVVEYGLHQWYVDDGAGFQPGPHSDPTTPVPGLDMKGICDYARSLGVGVRVWVHWAALYPKIDKAFENFEKWGLDGMMVDFMDRDDQEMVNIQTEILQKAAAHKLHVQFHGAYKPTGNSRTWPNEFTREGTLNYENNKWANYISPDMDINIPFTRGLAGSTDYHLGGFRAVLLAKIKPNYTRPLMLGTRCHMLAMYVVLESALGMVCDDPAAYEGQPGFEFIQAVPTTWDETKVLEAAVGEYLVVARRKGNKWYIGGIADHKGKSLSVPLGFLGKGHFKATVFSDGNDVAIEPNHLDKAQTDVTAGSTIRINMAAGGGVAAIIE